MKQKLLSKTNPYLRGEKAAGRRVRSLASSTAIETGKSIKVIEERINHLRSSKRRVTLA
ncbi:hypothetical protein [Sedimenticola selenatireducens]|uniref:hypothetical protein n=1 Tax=Sedimenticola selenatireducens TaxID=191960 RepID=UPI0004AC9FB8|nr:hypothetical protein [Sedimenticola selenatireducens]